MQASRNRLAPLANHPCAHAGLLLTRYLPEHASGDNSRVPWLLDGACAIGANDQYRVAYNRWQQATLQNSVRFNAVLASPLAIGLGNESPFEVGLTLHHTYGMPVIPGAALKGLCRRGAQTLCSEHKLTSEQFAALFGTTDDASFCIFWDAWYDPGPVSVKPLHRDVVTSHHPAYYAGKGDTFPTDFDDPNPVPFIVVRPGASFHFTLSAPEGWAQFLQELLIWSLVNLGIGGKTNAGYGYFLEPPPRPKPKPTVFWARARLTRKKNDESLIAVDEASGQVATSGGAAAKALFESLDDVTRVMLKKAAITVRAEVEIDGNSRQVKSIRPLND